MTGGEQLEDSDAFRGRLLGTSRTVWTLEAAQQRKIDAAAEAEALKIAQKAARDARYAARKARK